MHFELHTFKHSTRQILPLQLATRIGLVLIFNDGNWFIFFNRGSDGPVRIFLSGESTFLKSVNIESKCQPTTNDKINRCAVRKVSRWQSPPGNQVSQGSF